MWVCKICNRDLRIPRALSQHVKCHNLDSKSYYDTYLKDDGEGYCAEHGLETKWVNIAKCYQRYCSRKCGSSIRAKMGWNEERKELRRASWIPLMGGRPKGSKNKNPYPKEAAEKKRASIRKYLLEHKHNWEGRSHTEETKDKMSVSASERIQRNGLQMSYKGKYTPINKEKYKGDWTRIVYRSLWERKVMKYFDTSTNIIEWSSEELSIPYMGADSKRHLYFPDFLIKVEKSNGEIETVLIEVKPFKETVPPKPRKDGKRTRSTYINEIVYAKNKAKWAAAKDLCEEKGWKFQILTEYELGLAGKRTNK